MTRRFLLIFCLLEIGLLAGFSGRAQSRPGVALPGATPLVALDPRDPPAASYDLGIVDDLDPATVKHSFTLLNGTAKPLIVDDLTTSCGCTTASLTAGQQTKLPIKLQPGDVVIVAVSVDLTWQASPDVKTKTWLYVEGLQGPAATLTIRGRKQSAISIAPDRLDFGDAPGPVDRELIFTVVHDSRITVAGAPAVVGGGPVLSLSAARGQGQAADHAVGAKYVLDTYMVRLAATGSTGHVNAKVRVALGWPSIGGQILKSVDLPVVADVADATLPLR